MASLKLIIRLCVLAVTVASCTSMETATNASSFNGKSQFLQKLFDKYGKDDVISYSSFERLLRNVGITVVPQSSHDRKLNRSEHSQAHLLHPADGHHSDVEEEHLDAGVRDGLHAQVHAPISPADWNETQTIGSATTSHPGRGKRRGIKGRKGAAVVTGVRGRGKTGGSTRDKRSVGEDDHTKQHLHAVPRGRQCLTPRQILTAYHINVKKGITKPDFIHICPAIIYDIDQEACVASAVPSSTGVGWSANSSAASTNVTDAAALTRTFTEIPTKVWSYSLLAVAIISLAGLMCVAIIPVMQRCYFDEILHVLVALAVGTLTGDAMLHLMPHALLFGIVSKMTDSSMRHKAHVEGVWKGMTLLLGIYLFFIVERIVEIVSNRRKQKNKKTEGLYEIELGDTGNARSEQKEDGADAELVVKRRRDEDRDSEHYNHHGDDDKDGQRHGHSHGVPDSVSSMAWMIIMGDGLHNFTDGLAIGAAFSSSLPGGFSTTVAVFCHELPHELGDFAVLLRAGMSVKQALFYNIVSSALCLLGAISGVLVGNLGGMNLWVFAFTAGIFVYLSLVDMVPELISGNRDRKHPVRHLLLQLTGSSIGIGIMLLIALYERNLKTLFGN